MTTPVTYWEIWGTYSLKRKLAVRTISSFTWYCLVSKIHVDICFNSLCWPRSDSPTYFIFTTILTVCECWPSCGQLSGSVHLSLVSLKFSSQGGVQGKTQTDWEEGRTEESFDGKRERRGKGPFRVYCISLSYVSYVDWDTCVALWALVNVCWIVQLVLHDKKKKGDGVFSHLLKAYSSIIRHSWCIVYHH